MPAVKRYGEDLRAIGQALAAQGVAGFELHSVPAGYFVRDLREETSSFISKIWNSLRRESHHPSDFATYGFELPDVEELSKRGRARRSNPGQIPRFRDPSNILRTIGAYIDGKNAELLELHNRAISVTLVYRDRSGREYREDRPISSFQKVFVELIKKRTSYPARA
jgi:hypothetical protein